MKLFIFMTEVLSNNMAVSGSIVKVYNGKIVPPRESRQAVMNKTKQNPWPLVRKRTVPTERQPLVNEI
jgi:hypothetical protein